MPRVRTTKAVAKRIDLTYYNRWHPFSLTRRILVVACFVLALGWWAASHFAARGAIYNPGPVDSVHAMWESRCEVCHDKNGKFYKTVTDDACLKCHDGAIHHENQIAFVGVGSDGRKRSANCTECHTEHRGHTALLGTSDVACTRCHADLAKHDSGAVPEGMAKVTAFRLADHPRFGRLLRRPDKNGQPALVDPTVLRFNHSVHMEKVPVTEAMKQQGLKENCTICHVSEPAKVAAAGPQTRPVFSPDEGSGRYMQPINFESHCAACHPIDLSVGVHLTHGTMSQVRGQLTNLPALYLSYLRSLPDDERTKQLTETIQRGVRKTTRIITADEWLQKQLKKVSTDVNGWWDSVDPTKVPEATALKAAMTAQPSPDAPGGAPDPSVLELYVMRGLTNNSCTYCHDAQGVPQAVYTQRLKAATTQPAEVPPLLSTVPTGIPQTPRRWFAHSTFDHRAHRNMSCVSCHVNAPQSVVTSDVLSPDIQWKAGGKNVSCMDCHHSPESDAAGAGSNCVTCHVFHDRRLERPADGRFDVTEAVRGVVGPATQPASAAAPQSQPGA